MRIAVLLLLLITAPLQASQPLSVAVASNFSSTAKKIGLEFEAVSGVNVRFSSASTGLLYAQIVNGAPFDVFLAADQDTPRRLQQNGYALHGEVFDYARGGLVLWSTDASFVQDDCHSALLNGHYRMLAIANPRTAPYGLAAKRYLQSLDLWQGRQGRIVYGENVSQTYQFVASGNATLGLLAKSQVLAGDANSTTCLVTLDAAEVRQSGLVLRGSKDAATAQQFAEFLSSPTAIRILQQSGYTVGVAPALGDR